MRAQLWKYAFHESMRNWVWFPIPSWSAEYRSTYIASAEEIETGEPLGSWPSQPRLCSRTQSQWETLSHNEDGLLLRNDIQNYSLAFIGTHMYFYNTWTCRYTHIYTQKPKIKNILGKYWILMFFTKMDW